jgi:hypothetical protein
MITPRRFLAATLTLFFGALNVSFSLFELDRYNETSVVIAIGLVYFMTLSASVLEFRELRLSLWTTWFSTVIAVLIPLVSHWQLASTVIESKETWYVTAIAILLSVLAVRGRKNFAIIAGIIFISETIYFCGLEYFPKSGITGAVILIGAAVAISVGLESARQKIVEAQEILMGKQERVAFRQAVEEEYEIASRNIQKGVLPRLKRIAAGKHFSKADRAAYQLLEDELRDVVSGRRLINAKMKIAVKKARDRGVDVAFFDEGGLEFLKQEQLGELIDIVIAALSEIRTGRVTIRTQPHEPWLIRMTASRPRVVTPDLDLKLGER